MSRSGRPDYPSPVFDQGSQKRIAAMSLYTAERHSDYDIVTEETG